MKKIIKTLAICCLSSIPFAAYGGDAAADFNVIPAPQRLDVKNGKGFTLDSSTKIVYPRGNGKLEKVAGFLADYIDMATGLKLEITAQAVSRNSIRLQTGYVGETKNPEAYRLTVNSDGVLIDGEGDAGVFYGVQTLRKSLPIEKGLKAVSVPEAEISDYPRFSHRAAMLDVCRHFMPKEFIKKYIDLLAMHNINKFHWHLTDDQGWRLEIRKYPKLTEVGSKRSGTMTGHYRDKPRQYDDIPHGGYYTQEEAKEIVQYAADRFITVIPEIELPGHALAALASYPELGCTGGPYDVGRVWGIYEDSFCPGNEKTFEFFEDVFTEVLAIFPSEYIHIGGDECRKNRWKQCPGCQSRIKELGIAGDDQHTAEEKLQSYFVSRMEKFLNTKGRRIIGWDEILEGGLAPNATVMSWRGEKGGIAAAKSGHDAIMVPGTHLYFDKYQSKDTKKEPLAIGGFIPVEHVYNYNPVPKSLTESEGKHIIGVQCNLWTEYIATPEHAEYMLLPRLAALSEIQWLEPDKKNYAGFRERLKRFIPFYELYGYNYAKHGF